jgi:hypothetical protein
LVAQAAAIPAEDIMMTILQVGKWITGDAVQMTETIPVSVNQHVMEPMAADLTTRVRKETSKAASPADTMATPTGKVLTPQAAVTDITQTMTAKAEMATAIMGTAIVTMAMDTVTQAITVTAEANTVKMTIMTEIEKTRAATHVKILNTQVTPVAEHNLLMKGTNTVAIQANAGVHQMAALMVLLLIQTEGMVDATQNMTAIPTAKETSVAGTPAMMITARAVQAAQAMTNIPVEMAVIMMKTITIPTSLAEAEGVTGKLKKRGK